MKNNKIFIGGGLMQSQVYWILPIVLGYAKNTNIKEIILESKYKINLNTDIKLFFLNNFFYFSKICFWLFFIQSIFLFLKVFIKKNFKNSLRDNNILHSIIDTARIFGGDEEIKINFITAIKSIMYCAYKYTQAFILKQSKVNVVFLGHSVYGSRSQIAYFREFNIKIFCQASFVVYDNSQIKDKSWNTPDIQFFKKIESTVHYKEVSNFWKNRKTGNSSYIDAKFAFKGKHYETNSEFNLIMLHIFRDSPFSIIDNSRIFFDYYDWISETLNIISKSNEKWIIRLHPSGKRWGERSKLILQSIIKKNNLILRDNIIIDENKYSNMSLISNAKKVVTFSGTAHLEAACYGKKVIIISEVMLSKYYPSLVFKPSSINEYSSLLLSKNLAKFSINQQDTKKAQKLLFIREHLLSLKEDLSSIKIYRSDPKSLFLKEEKLVKSKSIKIQKNLFEMGSYLASSLPQTTSIKLMNKLNKKTL